MIKIIQQSKLNNKSLLNKIRYFTNKLLKLLEVNDKNITIVFTDVDFIKILNKKYFGKESATNVISFPFKEDNDLGEIYICIDVAKQEADEWEVSLFFEIFYLIIHGTLHLIGYDHVNDEKEAEIMENKEIELVEILKLNRWREQC